jgi:hypothetical protein
MSVTTLFTLLLGLVFQQPFDPQGRPNRTQPGPWDNDVVVYRVGRDGAAERLAAFPRAGVPTLARLADGRLIAAHQYFPADNDADFDKVAVHFSSDDGKTWTAPRVIGLTGLPDGMRFPFDPTLVPLPDGRVRLYFTSVRGRRIDVNPPAIYSAISANGLDFAVEPGVRFAVEGRQVIDCAVVLHNGMFHLYSPDNGVVGAGGPEGRGPLPNPAAAPPSFSAYHATSADGLTFTRQPDVTLGEGLRWLGNAQSEGDAIRFFGTGAGRGMPAGPPPGRGVGGPPIGPRPGGGIWTATSRDGFAWTRDATFTIAGADPGAARTETGGWIVVATGRR